MRFLLLLLFLPAFALTPSEQGHMLYLIQRGEVERSIREYREHQTEGHDLEALRQLGMVLLQAGATNGDPEDQLLSIFGAGITNDDQLLPILRSGLLSQHPQVQAASVHLLAKLDDDRADDLLNRDALASPFLLVRLEAIFQLAKRGYPGIVLQIETLMAKVPPPLRPLFPQIFAQAKTEEGDRVMRRMLADQDPLVRREAILCLTGTGRDDFLPEIRRMSRHLDPLQQEACAHALGVLRDSDSWSHLETLTQSGNEMTRLAALYSLYQLGSEESGREIAEIARSGNPYAITLLGSIEGYERILARLSRHSDVTVRVNAALSLLKHHDPHCLRGLRDVLLRDGRDLGFMPQSSIGGALTYIKVVPSMRQHLKDNPPLEEISRSIREAAFIECLELPEDHFLDIAEGVMRLNQQELIPMATRLLEARGTPAALELLQKESQRAGAPLVRDYCTLALFRSNQEGPHEEQLRAWVRRQQHRELIQLRPMVPFDKRKTPATPHTLTAQESSALLIESFEALAQRHDTDAVDALLDALEHGNPHNRYALAGLLIRLTE